jgi:class 3 adenylate cyclase
MEWDEDERVLFKGLRVRMGLHYGMAERVYDQVTKRYDYFGNTVNCAARVESIAKGGQVFISQPLFDAVKENLKLVDILQFSLSHDEAVTLEPKDILIGTTPVTPKDEFSEKILYRCEGSFQLKGIEEDVTVYEVMGDTLYKRSYDTPKKSTQSSRKSSISTSEQLLHETLPQSFSPKHVSFIEEQQPSSPEQIHVEE